MKKILITGGAGFIGSEIVNQLQLNGDYEVTVLDCMSRQIHGFDWRQSYLYRSIVDKCRFVKASVTDFDAMRAAIDGAECVIHLAAETGTGQSMYEINRYNEVNVMGTSNLLQAISLAGADRTVRKIILSSSRSVYGEGKYNCPNCGIVYPDSRAKGDMLAGDFNPHCPGCGGSVELLATDENSEVIPASLYAYTKRAQEMMLQTMCPALGVDYTILRFQNVYGAGQSLKNPYTGILSVFSSLMLEDGPVNIFEDGRESRDFVHVTDVARGVIAAIDSSRSNGEIINLGSGVSASVMEVAEILKRHYGSGSNLYVTGDFRIGDIAHNKADISKARDILGFEPTVLLEDGLASFCEWVIGQDCDNSGYERSLIEMERVGMLVRA